MRRVRPALVLDGHVLEVGVERWIFDGIEETYGQFAIFVAQGYQILTNRLGGQRYQRKGFAHVLKTNLLNRVGVDDLHRLCLAVAQQRQIVRQHNMCGVSDQTNRHNRIRRGNRRYLVSGLPAAQHKAGYGKKIGDFSHGKNDLRCKGTNNFAYMQIFCKNMFFFGHKLANLKKKQYFCSRKKIYYYAQNNSAYAFYGIVGLLRQATEIRGRVPL